MREAGASLSTLTSLFLNVEDTGVSVVTAAALDRAMVLLVSACPLLTSITFSGELTEAFLRVLGERCPLLSTLSFVCPVPENPAYLQQLFRLQPSLLPHITCLTLDNCCEVSSLPNMSTNISIRTLSLESFSLLNEAEWLSLPPNLQHLECGHIQTGPPMSTVGRVLLGSLLVLELLYPVLSLQAFVQLLRAVPSLKEMKSQHRGRDCRIECNISISEDSNTGANLAFLLGRMENPTIGHAIYVVDCSREDTRASLCPVIATLPILGQASWCELTHATFAELGLLLKIVPNATHITLTKCEVTDVELQALAVSVQLTTLKLIRCPKISPIGLFALCQRLPRLLKVVGFKCPLLEGTALETCVQLLRQQGSIAKLGVQEHLW